MRFRVGWLGLLALVPVIGGGIAPAQEEGKVPSGPAVGSKAPGFTLKDQSGRERSLDGLLRESKGKVALVFYRSADW